MLKQLKLNIIGSAVEMTTVFSFSVPTSANGNCDHECNDCCGPSRTADNKMFVSCVTYNCTLRSGPAGPCWWPSTSPTTRPTCCGGLSTLTAIAANLWFANCTKSPIFQSCSETQGFLKTKVGLEHKPSILKKLVRAHKKKYSKMTLKSFNEGNSRTPSIFIKPR